jgi:hypothetical protein
MRIGILIFCCLLALQSIGQQPLSSNWQSNGSHNSFVRINAGVTAASSNFTNQFAKSLLLDDQLNKEALNAMLSNMDMRSNRLGGDYEVGLEVKWNPKKSAHSLLFKMADVAHAHGSVPSTAIQLGFLGNAQFAGDTVDFSGMEFSAWRYQQIGIGWNYKHELSWGVYAMASYINGEQFAQAQVDRAWLYTSVLGDTLSTGLKGQYIQSDTARAGFAVPNGTGAALDFGFSTQFEGESSLWNFKVDVHHLGLVQWSPASLRVNADTNWEWTGMYINDIEQANTQFSDGRLEYSLRSGVNGNFSKGLSNQWLPGWLSAELMQYNPRNAEFGVGMVARWNAGYDPFGYIKGGYRFNEKVAAHMVIGYGGFATFQFGVQGGLEFDRFSVQASVNNLEALVVPSRFLGATGRLCLKYNFG